MNQSLFRGLLFAILSVSAAGQPSDHRYEALKPALGLSDSQVIQIEAVRQSRRADFTARWLYALPSATHPRIDGANSPAPTSDSVGDRILDDSQRARVYERGISELGLSEFQLSQFEQLQRAAGARPSRDQSWAVLDDAQKAKLAEFENALKLAHEAIELALIPRPLKGEPLCH